MSATQPNLGSGARRLAALSCVLGLLGLAACGSTGLPAGLEGSSRGAQSTDAGVMRSGTAGRTVGPTTPIAGRSPTAGAPTGGVAGTPPPMPRDAGVTRDGGFATDAGMPTWADSGVVAIDAGMPCDTGVYAGSLEIFDKRGLMMLRGCKEVSGDLTIGANAIDDLSDLHALSTIGGGLLIRGYTSDFAPSSSTTLKSLKGLEGLRSVSSLTLIGLAGVTSLEPLAGLSSAFSVQLVLMDGLTNLNGLAQLKWSNIAISDTAQLKTFEGLRIPEEVGSIELSNNVMLADLKSLAALRRIDSLRLDQLPALKSLDGLQNIQSGYESLGIAHCNALVDLTGLSTFGRMTGIEGNAELRSLAGPSPAQRSQYVLITNNPKLENLAGIVPIDQETPSSIALEGLPSLKSLADLKTLRRVEGLGIGTCDGLKDLTGLEALASAQAIEIVDCAGMQSLKGLDALQSVESMNLNALNGLTSLQGVPKLQRIGGLSVSGCGSLPGLQGLESVTALGGIDVSGNLALKSLQGLEKVTEVGSLNIVANTALPNLMGLSGLQTVSTLQVSGNPALKNLQGIGLRAAESLSIDANPVLTDLMGLENLAGVATTLSIVQNTSLTSLRALSALMSTGGLYVEGNRRLPQCEVEWLAKRVNQPAPMATNGPPGMCAP